MSKLVRDKIPEIILRNEGVAPLTHIVRGEELVKALDTKLDEEIGEFRNAPDDQSAAEEIADVMEVLFALARQKGYTLEQIEAIRLEKRAKRGGFEQGIILE